MYARIEYSWKFLAIILTGLLVLTGCNLVADAPILVPGITEVPPRSPVVVGSEQARDAALAYIRTYHPGTGPSKDAFWFDETMNQEGLVGSSSIMYRYESWGVTVTFPVVAPDSTVYTITVERISPRFLWQGLIDAYGQVEETFFETSNTTEDLQPTAPLPTSTALPSPTVTLIPAATATPVPTSVPTSTATATAIPDPCNAVKFVADVTVQDGTQFMPGVDFIKTWRLKNTGTCTWTADYDLIFVDGRLMGGNQTQPLPGSVKPGETIDISLNLEAPKDPGDYIGFWMLRDDGGEIFGVGSYANKAFWVSITVVDFDEGDYVYDFALNYCAATWWSQTERLTCPGFINSTDGFVQLLSNADLELRREDQPTLWVHPNEERYGWIEGTYPEFEVEAGDHFMAWVGCMEGYDRCSLNFYLAYIDRNGKFRQLGEWSEIYDGEVTKIDIDLSDLAGKTVRFVLGLRANTKNVEDAQGFWFVPRIE